MPNRSASGIVDILVRVKEQGKEIVEGYRKQLTNLDAALQKLGLSQKSASRVTAVLGSDFAIAAGTITGVGLAIAGVAKGVQVAVKALKALTDESEQAAKSQRLLENAVKLSGGSIGRMTDEVERLSKQFGIGDEKAAPFVAAVNKLVQAVGRPQDLEKFSQALLDIGAARSEPVENVASAVEAATRGMTRGLEQLLGMDVDGYLENYAKALGGTKDELTDLGRQTAIYNLINEQAVKVQGAAQAEAETASGQYAILLETLNTLEEQVGQGLTPVFIELVKWLNAVIKGGIKLWEVLDPNNAADAFRAWLVDLGIVADDFRDVTHGAESVNKEVAKTGPLLKQIPGAAATAFAGIVKAATDYVDVQLKLKDAHIGTATAQANIARGLAALKVLYADAMTTDEQRLVLMEKIKAAQLAIAGPTPVALAESFDAAVTAAQAYLDTQVKLQQAGVQTAENQEAIRRGLEVLQTLYQDSRLTDEQRLAILAQMQTATDALAAAQTKGNKVAQEALTPLQQATQGMQAYKEVNTETGAVIDQQLIPAILRGSKAVSDHDKTVKKATDTTAQFAQSMAEAIAGPLDDFFKTVIEGNLSLSESFKEMGRAILKAITAIISQMLAWMAVQALFKALGFDITTPFSKKATGGYISGKGTGTSDSIPARLSHGEYVMTAEAVRRLGLQNLNALNYGARGFRDGGLVAPGAMPHGAGTLGAGTVNLGIGLQDGLVLDYIQSDAGGAVMISHIEKNRNAVRRVLGMR